MSRSRGTPVTLMVASLTSVILPSGLIVTNGSRLASIRLRAYRKVARACSSACLRCRDVVAHEQIANWIAGLIVAAGDDDVRPEARAVLADSLRPRPRPIVFQGDPQQALDGARVHILGDVQDFDIAAEDFFRRILVVPSGPLVPRQDPMVEVLADDRVPGGTIQNVIQKRLRIRKLTHDALGFGHVARGGEHADHVAADVLVNRRVVENVGKLAEPVTDGQRVIGDEAPIGEDLPITLARQFSAGSVK